MIFKRNSILQIVWPTVDAYPDGAIGRGARYECATAGSLPLCLGQRERCEGNTPYDVGSCAQLGASHTWRAKSVSYKR